jgi:hypothetical protein
MKNKMECPNCSALMEVGSFHIGSTILGFLAIGFSFKHLFFTNKKGEKSEALNNHASKPGFKCVKCNLLDSY